VVAEIGTKWSHREWSADSQCRCAWADAEVASAIVADRCTPHGTALAMRKRLGLRSTALAQSVHGKWEILPADSLMIEQQANMSVQEFRKHAAELLFSDVSNSP